jgi:lipoprotein NlpD
MTCWYRYLHVSAFVISLAIAPWLTACSNGKKWNPDDYTVKSGDTVYSIAWRYELDPEEFASWNNLGSSGLIRPGQRLHTRPPANYRPSSYRQSRSSAGADTSRSASVAYAPKSTSRSRSTVSTKKWVVVEKGDSLSRISKRTGVSVERLAQLNQLKKPYVIQPGQTIFLKPLSSSGSKQSNKSARKSSAGKTSKSSGSSKAATQSMAWPKRVSWKRPARGKVVEKFNRNRIDAKGIEIKGKKGDAVVAAAKGQVVYSGDGLVSYGNLIIIKHNKTYLSAYAYNHKLLVKEGEVVKAGQRIAQMGLKNKKQARLHFEIRKNGKPVDPLKYLPWK